MTMTLRSRLPLLALLVLGLCLTAPTLFAADALTPILAKNAVWKYLDTGVDQGSAWRGVDFDDKSWKSGKAPLGFGDDFSETDPTLPLATTVAFGKADDKYMTTYFRSEFTVVNPAAFKEVETYIHVDDGAVVYVNGVELYRRGIEEKIPVLFATPGKFKPKEETFRLPTSFLKAGKNVIAVEVHQDGGDSSDLWFELSFSGVGGAAPVAAASPSPAGAKAWVLAADPSAATGLVSKVTLTMGPDAATSRGFTWYTSRASINSTVQLVEVGNAASKLPATLDFAKAISRNGKTTESITSPAELVHKVEVIGLKPGTRYAYRTGDQKLGLWSANGTFVTAAATSGFSFIDLADTQAKTEDEAELSARTLAKALATVPAASFIALNGDLVDTGMNENQWDWFLGKSQPTLLATTFVPAAGNHEEDPSSFIHHFALPVPFGSSTVSGAYYSFNQQNAHFIVLNNNEDSPEYANFTPSQIDWLKSDAAQARKTGAQWLVVIMHKGPYTTSNHATDADIMGANGVRTLVAPLFSTLGIDLVLQGHDHIYARSLPIKDAKASKPTIRKESFQGQSVEYLVKPQGTVYLIPATAGPKVYYRNKKIDPAYYSLFAKADENHAAAYGPDPADASRPLRGQIQNFVSFSIDGAKLTGLVYEIDAAKNNGAPFVVDSFGISK